MIRSYRMLIPSMVTFIAGCGNVGPEPADPETELISRPVDVKQAHPCSNPCGAFSLVEETCLPPAYSTSIYVAVNDITCYSCVVGTACPPGTSTAPPECGTFQVLVSIPWGTDPPDTCYMCVDDCNHPHMWSDVAPDQR